MEGNNYEKNENAISKVFKVTGGLIWVAAFIAGFIVAQKEYHEFSIFAMIICWCSGFIGGLLIYGFGEVIELLQQIVSKKQDNELDETLPKL